MFHALRDFGFTLPERAKELANLIGGHALTLAELENFHPEDGMVLANTTSIGMQPNINDTPLSKVCYYHYLIFNVIVGIALNLLCGT